MAGESEDGGEQAGEGGVPDSTPSPTPPPSPSTDTTPTVLTWADNANAFVQESYEAMLVLSGVVLSITMLSVGAGVIISIFRRAGREGGG